MHILEKKVCDASAEGRTALIPFVTAGYPTPDAFWNVVEELDAAGADVIEIGVPFSDPVADGPVVEAASVQALASGITLHWIMEGLRERRGRFRAGLVLMGYMNPILQYGPDSFARDAADAGVAGCIIPDVPLEESGELRAMLGARGIALIPLVGQNTAEERMREYAEQKGLILACGPLPFLKTVHGFARELNARVQLSLENRMACGVGACLGCVTRTTEEWPVADKRNGLVQTCNHGPVFWANQIEL